MQNNSKALLPPQAIDAEEFLLCSLMSEPASFHRISSWITTDSFYKEDHKIIFSAVTRLHTKSQEVDFITVSQSLRVSKELDQIGGPARLIEITRLEANSANIERHALIIQQKYLQRQMISTCSEFIKKAYDDAEDIFELYDEMSNSLFQKVAVNVGKQAVIIADILKEQIKVYDKPAITGLSGLGSGYPSIDKLTGGWQPQELIIIAARPGMGKTAYALNIARHAAIQHETPVAIFSLEMSKEQLVDRMVSAETDIYFGKIRHRSLTEHDVKKIMGADSLIDSKIFIDDSGQLSIQAFRSKAIRLKHKHNIGLIVVDYLQLMKGDRENKSGNREQEVSSITRGLKAVAKELNIPVIALSQLSRALESRPGANGKRPLLSDLRESGAIEQDADIVNFLYRPEYYDVTEDEQGRSLAGICESIFAKNRSGELDTAVMRFNGAFMKFSEIDDIHDPVEVQTMLPLQPNENFDRPSGNIIIKPSRLEDLEDQDAPF